jgi:hypothetical protein
MSPRPILKHSVSTEHHHQHQHQSYQHNNHGVHFPPSPALARTFSAYSASAYDRSPIVVSPTSCALPERGCPGRTYLLEEQAAPAPRGIAYARDYHPRALAFACASSSNYTPPVPQLIPDLSSESDESDGFSSLPGELVSSTQTFGPHGLAGPYNSNGMSGGKNSNATNMNMNGYTPCDDNTLAFLPYAPSSPSNYYPISSSPPPPPSSSPHYLADPHGDGVQNQKPRRRGERRHESDRDPDRIPRCAGGGGDPSLGFASLSISPPSLSFAPAPAATHKSGSPTRKKGVRRQVAGQSPPGCGGFGMADDGCLGGF